MSRTIIAVSVTLLSVAATVQAQTSAPAATRSASLTAVEAWLAAAKQRDAKGIREMTIPLGEPGQAERIFASIEAGEFPPRGEVVPLETIEQGDCAIALVRFVVRAGRPDFQDLPMIRVDGVWKVALFEPSPEFKFPAEYARHAETFEALRKAYAARKRQLLAAAPDDRAAEMTARRQTLALSAAISGGKVDEVRRLLDAGASAEGSGGASPLKAAIEAGQREIAALLIERGARMRPSWIGDWLGSSKRGREAARLAVELGIDVNAPIDGGPTGLATPLLAAVAAGDVELAKLMVARGGTLADQDRLATTFLNAAAGSGDWATFEWVAGQRLTLAGVDRDGSNALHALVGTPASTGTDRGRIARNLLQAGVDAKAVARSPRFDVTAQTPLRLAAYAERDDVVIALIDGVRFDRAELNAALTLASKRCRVETLAALIDKGAVPAEAPDAKSSPLHNAVLSRDAAKVRLLLERGHPIDVRVAPRDRTPLQQAVVQGTAEMVSMLLGRGADATARDAEGLDAKALARVRLERGREYDGANGRSYSPELRTMPEEGRQVAALFGIDAPPAATQPAD